MFLQLITEDYYYTPPTIHGRPAHKRRGAGGDHYHRGRRASAEAVPKWLKHRTVSL